jgi:hypothetical protein
MNNTADPNKTSPLVNPQVGNIPQSASIGKEHESLQVAGIEEVKEISKEIEIPEEVKKAGVTLKKETIELPPDVKKLGVTPTGASVPISQAAVLPKVSLPISDDQVIVGLHTQITNALHWLAIWCIKKLKKAHIILKVIHGKIIRVGIK